MKIVCMGRNLVMGGMERQLTGLAAALKVLGHDVSILTYRSDRGFFDSFLAEHGIPKVQLIKRRAEPLICFERRLASKLSELDAEVVIAYGHGANRKAAMAHLFNRGFKLIVSERSANPRINPFDLYKMIIYKHGADLIVTNSYRQEDIFRKAFPNLTHKLTTIPNFVDTEIFHPGEKPGGGKFVFITTARITPRKNIMNMIRATRIAIDRGADIKVMWYGKRSNSSNYAKRSIRLVEKLDLTGRFEILDGSSYPEELYRQADAFCLPSLYEGTSNSLAEAMASGLPVICSDAGDNARYVHDGTNGFIFNPKDPDSIADAMIRLYGCDHDMRMRMGCSGRQTVSKHLSLDAFIINYQKIL